MYMHYYDWVLMNEYRSRIKRDIDQWHRCHHQDMFGGPGRGPHRGGPDGFGNWRPAGPRHDWKYYSDDEPLRNLFHQCMKKMHMNRNHPSTQDMILRILYEENGLSQGILQKVLDIQPGSMSEILAKLEAKEYISRSKDESDRRRVFITLTDAGTEYIKDKLAYDVDGFAKNLTDEEKETLKTLLLKIIG